MKNIKKILGIIVGLFVLYIIMEFAWSLLNIQSCEYDLPKDATCEQIAENNANNCNYVILKWKKVDYNKELSQCQEWQGKQK